MCFVFVIQIPLTARVCSVWCESFVLAPLTRLSLKWLTPILHPVSQHRTKTEDPPQMPIKPPSPLCSCHPPLCVTGGVFLIQYDAHVRVMKFLSVLHLHILTATRRMLSNVSLTDTHRKFSELFPTCLTNPPCLMCYVLLSCLVASIVECPKG